METAFDHALPSKGFFIHGLSQRPKFSLQDLISFQIQWCYCCSFTVAINHFKIFQLHIFLENLKIQSKKLFWISKEMNKLKLLLCKKNPLKCSKYKILLCSLILTKIYLLQTFFKSRCWKCYISDQLKKSFQFFPVYTGRFKYYFQFWRNLSFLQGKRFSSFEIELILLRVLLKLFACRPVHLLPLFFLNICIDQKKATTIQVTLVLLTTGKGIFMLGIHSMTD